MVTVKNRDKGTVCDCHGVIDVAGLSMIVLNTFNVAHSNFASKIFDHIATAIIEHIDVKLIGRPVHVLSGINRGLNHIQRFVIGRDKNVHIRPQGFIVWHRIRLTIKHPTDLEVSQHHHDKCVKFSSEQQRT